MPTQIGYQDIASRLMRQPGMTERWQQHLFTSPSLSLRVASFNFLRPIGTSVPEAASNRLANVGELDFDVTGSINRNPLGVRPLTAADFPAVIRTAKGDRFPVIAPAESKAAESTQAEIAKSEPLDEELQAALNSPRLSQYEESNTLDDKALAALHAAPGGEGAKVETVSRDPFSMKTSSLFFGNSSLGESSETLERWQPGEEPVIVSPNADPDLKRMVALTPHDADPSKGGETIAGKGEVNTANTQALTPAERLHLDAKARAKGEKCLASAIYGEARGEAVRGQIAVAQVVMNRVFSGFYPDTICGVVYQNANRHNACQFTFACDDVKDAIEEPDMWDRAKKIARAMLNGQLWLPEVGKSTHYHAYWVRPSWVGEMKKMYRFGVHTFYRPRAWGDGHEAPTWGTPAQTAEISRELADAAKSSAEIEAAKR